MPLPWTRKYIPDTAQDIIGQDEAAKRMRLFVRNFSQQKHNGMLLYGPSGSGKTASVCALAKELDQEILEVNASDSRNKASLHTILGEAIRQRSFFSDGKIILIDEVEGLSGTQDRGGIPEIVKLIKETKFPIFLTCQDPFDKKFKALRKATDSCEFRQLTSAHIAQRLRFICEQEGVECDLSVLEAIARKSQGDMRAAINDLQVLAAGKQNIDKEDFAELSERAKVQTIETALTTIFKSTDPVTALGAFDDVQEDFDQRFLWIDYNLPKEYTDPKDLARAYGCLAKADVYRQRIRRRQHWRFLVYINALLTAGIATAKNAPYKRPPMYKQTTRLLRIWQINMSQAKKRSIAQKIAAITHTSTSYILKNFGFYHSLLNSTEFGLQLQEEFDLGKDEIAWLKKKK
ncbi:MAG: replication factor C large subunit [Nanoarchaeota archaeon]